MAKIQTNALIFLIDRNFIQEDGGALVTSIQLAGIEVELEITNRIGDRSKKVVDLEVIKQNVVLNGALDKNAADVGITESYRAIANSLNPVTIDLEGFNA